MLYSLVIVVPDEQDFGRIQKDKVAEMKTWASKIKRVIKEQGRRKNINLAIVAD